MIHPDVLPFDSQTDFYKAFAELLPLDETDLNKDLHCMSYQNLNVIVGGRLNSAIGGTRTLTLSRPKDQNRSKHYCAIRLPDINSSTVEMVESIIFFPERGRTISSIRLELYPKQLTLQFTQVNGVKASVITNNPLFLSTKKMPGSLIIEEETRGMYILKALSIVSVDSLNVCTDPSIICKNALYGDSTLLFNLEAAEEIYIQMVNQFPQILNPF